jgi:hypothetical protein
MEDPFTVLSLVANVLELTEVLYQAFNEAGDEHRGNSGK